VHVRPVADRVAAARLLDEARAAADSSLTLKPGKDVLEIAVTDAHKGAALRRLVDGLGVAGSIYLGDDVTDEDGFRALGGPADVTVKIGEGPTEARHRVSDTVGAVALLNRLADLLV
jgi:trehalose 6-phosphate phosphatase